MVIVFQQVDKFIGREIGKGGGEGGRVGEGEGGGKDGGERERIVMIQAVFVLKATNLQMLM